MGYKAVKTISSNNYFFIKNYNNIVNEGVNYAVKSEKMMKNVRHKNLINMINSFEYKNNIT
jgi:hypothetical protein